MGSSSAIELSHVDQLTRNQLTFGMEVTGAWRGPLRVISD